MVFGSFQVSTQTQIIHFIEIVLIEARSRPIVLLLGNTIQVALEAFPRSPRSGWQWFVAVFLRHNMLYTAATLLFTPWKHGGGKP